MILKVKQLWRVWCKALGEKASPNDNEADTVAVIRTLILLTYVITNAFIVGGVIRHWDDVNNSEKCAILSVIKNG